MKRDGLAFDERLRFEALLTRLSTRFINLPANRVDAVVREAQRQVCEGLHLDYSTLWQFDRDQPDTLLLTHYHVAADLLPGFPAVPRFMDARKSIPWSLGKILKGEMIVLSRISDAPAAAARSKKVWRHYGTKSIVALPLSTGREKPFGALSFCTLREERVWSPELIRRLRLVAQIFANALARARSDQLLRESEERLALATTAASAGLWALNATGTSFWISPKIAEMFGLPPGESLKFDRFVALVHPEDRAAVRAATAAAMVTTSLSGFEYRIVRPDGNIRWMQSRGCLAAGSLGKTARLTGLTADITERKEMELERLRNSAKLDRLAAQLANARDEEQKRIASGLHDDVAQLMLAVRIKLQQARAEKNPRVRAERLADAERFVDMADRSIRELAFELGSATLYTLGLPKALEELCENVRGQFAMRFVYAGRMKKVPLDEQKAVVLFKSTRELLFNVAKHAGVADAAVRLRQGGGKVVVVVEDRGRGTAFSLRRGAAGEGTGLGLFSISNRMESIGGGMDFASAPGAGTRVTLWAPVDKTD